MNSNQSLVKLASLFALLIFFFACQSSLDIGYLLKDDSSIYVTISQPDSISQLNSNYEIEVGDDKFKLLYDWAKQNTDGWTKTPASYLADIYVKQGDFSLLYWKGGNNAVISFIDKNGTASQYSKKIGLGELDFLFD